MPAAITLCSASLLHVGFNQIFVAKCALFLAIIFGWTVACSKILHRFLGLPIIAGQIIGGIILGPSILHIGGYSFFADPVSIHTIDGSLINIASVDLVLFTIVLLSSVLTIPYILWAAGHETNIESISNVGLVAILAGIAGALMPIAGVVLAWMCGILPGWSFVQATAIGLAFAATSVSIPVAMLAASGKMHLKSSQATLGAAVVDDILAVILLSCFVVCLQAGYFGVMPVSGLAAEHTLFGLLFAMVMAFCVLASVGYFIVPHVIDMLKRKDLYEFIVPVATTIMLLMFAFVELVGGLAGITGAYFAGLFHQLGDRQHTAQETISPFVQAILLPLFLGTIGLQVDMRLLGLYEWFFVLLLLIIAIGTKLLGCLVATKVASNKSWSGLQTYLFGASMVARGEVGLVISSILYGAAILTPQQYIVSVVVIVLTTVAAPIMLGIGFEYEERNYSLHSS